MMAKCDSVTRIISETSWQAEEDAGKARCN